MTKAPISSGRSWARDPLNALPIGVRTVSTITASGICWSPCACDGQALGWTDAEWYGAAGPEGGLGSHSMAEGRIRSPRIRMPKVSLPGRSRTGGDGADEKTTEAKAKAPAKPVSDGKAAPAKEGA